MVKVARWSREMSKGLGKVERLILNELRLDNSHTVDSLAVAVITDGDDIGILSIPSSDAAWQSAARAVRSLIKKGLISRQKTTKHLTLLQKY